ncbi:MAG: hypothetical protein IID09_02205 [Candidatus Hydrogenedentes bacterium]|nr:hypothetical protein [Candidatus Hydrogenedentota bacterium]
MGYRIEWAQASGDSADGLADALDKRIASDRIDGILPAAAWALAPVAEAAARHELPALSCAAASYLSNRRSLRERLAARGVPQAEYRYADSPETAVESAEGMEPPFYVVSDEGGSARESVAEFREDLALAAKRASGDNSSSGLVIESHPRGDIFSLFCCMYDGDTTISAILGHRSAEAPYRFPMAVYCPATANDDLQKGLCVLAREALDALQFDFGAVRVDILACADSFLVLDVDPFLPWMWMPIDLIELAGGASYIENVLRMAAGEAPDVGRTRQAAALAWIPARPGRIVSIHGLKQAASVDGVAQIQIFARPGDTLRHRVDSAGRDRVGYIAATGPDTETALARVERALECCRIETSTIR